ncbi:MAG: hypothetical protein WD042_20225 [Phycisphaeraceae bacterium]
MPDSLTRSCPAKVNLALSIGSPLRDGADAGMHPIASWMVALDFGDTLTLTRLVDLPSRFDLSFADNAPRPSPIDWPIEKDLCHRAHALLQAHVRHDLPVHLSLQKRVPTGAGMGGGSGDAAGTLVGLNDQFHLGLDDATLSQLGSQLGSDVPFFIAAARGQPSALVTGLGNVIEPLPLRTTITLVLIFPPIACPTGAVYRAFDQSMPQPATHRAPQSDRVRTLAASSALSPHALFNDLAEPACIVQPALRRLRDNLIQQLQMPVHITGSGSTLFVLAADRPHADQLAAIIASASALPIIIATTI